MEREIMTERKQDGDKLGVTAKTAAGAVGFAGTLIRLSAGVVILAWIGFLLKDRAKRKRKLIFSPHTGQRNTGGPQLHSMPEEAGMSKS